MDYQKTGSRRAYMYPINAIKVTFIQYLAHEIHILSSNLFRGFFIKATYLYPFYGVKEFAINSIYWKFLIPLLYPYMMLTSIVAILYYITIFPIVLANYTLIMGVIGFILAHLQFILNVNTISLTISQILLLPTNKEQYFMLVLRNHGKQEFLMDLKRKRTSHVQICKDTKSKKFKFITMIFGNDNVPTLWKNRNNARFWVNKAPLIIFFTVYDVIKMILILCASLVPFLGPIIVVILRASSKSHNCLNPYFKLKQISPTRQRQIVHRNYGQFLAFGLVANVLELLPYVSLIFQFTNFTGGAIWASYIIDSKYDIETT